MNSSSMFNLASYELLCLIVVGVIISCHNFVAELLLPPVFSSLFLFDDAKLLLFFDMCKFILTNDTQILKIVNSFL